MKKIPIYLFLAIFIFNTFSVNTFAYTTQEKENRIKTVVIDPGHQAKANNEKEPVNPNGDMIKAKVTAGTKGRYSGMLESELVLDISLLLKDELVKRGYDVVLTRETQDVDISNVQRAKIANDLNADAFIRIHADGSLDESVEGVTTICQTKENPYNGDLYYKSFRLSSCLLENVCSETGAKKRYVNETDTMSGINWAKVPVSIIEVGFLTNKKEDLLLQTDEYREKIVIGIANGIDEYFSENYVEIPSKNADRLRCAILNNNRYKDINFYGKDKYLSNRIYESRLREKAEREFIKLRKNKYII